MSFTALALALLTPPAPLPPPPPSDLSGRRLSLYVGARSYDEDDWAPVEDQVSLGFEFSSAPSDQAVGWEIGTAFSRDTGTVGALDVEASFFEIYGGLRKEFDTGSSIHPYLGAGLTLIAVDAEVSLGGLSASDDDASPGLYLHGGALADVSESFFIGLDLRAVLGTDMDFSGVSFDADYTQVALVLGLGI